VRRLVGEFDESLAWANSALTRGQVYHLPYLHVGGGQWAMGGGWAKAEPSLAGEVLGLMRRRRELSGRSCHVQQHIILHTSVLNESSFYGTTLQDALHTSKRSDC
jgi:hypothetical protein